MESSSEPPKKKLKETHYPSNQEFNYSFLEAISSQCTLLFKSPASLEQFAAKAASALPQPGSGEITMRRLLIELDVFREDQLPNASDLEEWKRLQCPHGFPQGAREHFEEWMNAVQKVLELGFTLHVTIRCRKPFRDYVSFREQSSVLRDPKVTVEIDLDKAAWSQVPQHYRPLLMAMVEFSITGVQLEKELEDQRVGLANKEEWYLNRHGCLVVRGLRVVHYRQSGNTPQQSEMRTLGCSTHTNRLRLWMDSLYCRERNTPKDDIGRMNSGVRRAKLY